MKKVFTLFSLILMFGVAANAQPFTVEGDTILVPNVAGGTVYPHDNITNKTANTLTISWYVADCNFPDDWLNHSALGICDNTTCYTNLGNATSGVLWSSSTHSGNTFTCRTYYANAAHDTTENFDLQLNLANATTGGVTRYIKVYLQDSASGYNKIITFLVTRVPVAVPQVVASVSDVILYPNPARDEVNVVFDASADVKSVAVYSIIGKMMTVYKVAGNSANLSIGDMPAGVYFLRLMNSEGNIVSTKKFTKQ